MALLDVARNPGIADMLVVDAFDLAVYRAPGGVCIAAGADDVEEARELAAQPGAAVVLVRDGVDAQAADRRVDGFFRARALQAVQGLRQRIGPTPDADPQRARVGPLELASQQFGAGAVASVAGGLQAVAGLPRRDARSGIRS